MLSWSAPQTSSQCPGGPHRNTSRQYHCRSNLHITPLGLTGCHHSTTFPEKNTPCGGSDRQCSFPESGVGCGRYFIGPIQFLVCFGAVVGSTLLAGQSMKSIYLIAKPEGPIKLYVFVIIFGTLMLVLAQLPSFHSLRHVNLVSLLLCLAIVSVPLPDPYMRYVRHTKRAPVKDYSLVGSTQDRVFGVFNAIAIIATTYGNGIIPEIQATAAAPVKGKMFKGLCLCYTIVVCTFFGVAISGYWAFGNQAAGTILSNFAADGGATDLIPKWLFTITNVFTLLQLSAVGVVYLQPTNEVLEGLFANPTEGQHSARNVVPRLIFRSLSVIWQQPWLPCSLSSEILMR
uniref:Amino acid transporter transmembrane domain-containing protein n=1 Tax=Ananas comosus var. bracteatus TaxID=296719 RepID=A0A6V7NHM8_ANACO|nr:unnamed protein product [Ananas comosus var. bracteatus]